MTVKTDDFHSGSMPLAPCSAGFLQFDVRLGDIEANLAKVREGLVGLAPRAPGIIVLPELWATGFAYADLQNLAFATPRLLEALRREAERHGVFLAGSLPEAVLTEIGTSIFNTLYLVGPRGTAGQYRKQQLFAPMGEEAHFSPGDNPRPIDTGLGLVAALVCYDLRFPELARNQAAQGAGLLVVSAQWPAARLHHWRTLLQARAVENQLFVVGCNRCGAEGGEEFAGHSMVIAPDGAVLAEAAAKEEAAMTALDPAALSRARRRFHTAGVSPYRFHDQDKIIDPEALQEVVRRSKVLGSKVVFTNGCFDILHQGHVTYLEAARKEGDRLVVGLNSDSSIRAIKGPDRPLNHEQSRARLLAALGCVDHVVLFSEETPRNLITTLMPDVLVKGGDWPVDRIVGAPEVLAGGGRVLSIPLVDNFSTTSLIEKIKSG